MFYTYKDNLDKKYQILLLLGHLLKVILIRLSINNGQITVLNKFFVDDLLQVTFADFISQLLDGFRYTKWSYGF